MLFSCKLGQHHGQTCSGHIYYRVFRIQSEIEELKNVVLEHQSNKYIMYLRIINLLELALKCQEEEGNRGHKREQDVLDMAVLDLPFG